MMDENLNKDQQNQLLMMMLIQQHQQIAMVGMGKLKNPATDAIERDLASSKYAIDTLSALDQYTQNNLPEELKGYLDQVLTTLRLNYADEIEKEKTDSNSDENEASNEEN